MTQTPDTQPNDLPKAYEPADVEKRWLDYWLNNGCFRAADVSEKPSYCIVIPPPNVTGSLHIGHAMDNTLQDVLIRWKRMSGYNTLWMPGTDHAGIITEVVMEGMLSAEGTSRYEIGRDAFLERMWQWKDESRGNIVGQLQRLGASCDWERERFTMDAEYMEAVPVAFKRLYDAGYIYRGEAMVNWVPGLQTSVSDLEVEHEDRPGHFYYLKYKVKGSDRELVIATTRPETMLGDTAVAVHPNDERYQDLIGKTAILPLVGREIPIIADEYVDVEFGTGALKVTPGHDPNDYEIGNRHDLERINIFNKDASINENGGEYEGLNRYACREKLVDDLRNSGHLLKIEEHTHSVGVHERTKEPVEPLVAPGWFMKMKPLADNAMKEVEKGNLRFIPENQTNIFGNWMANVRDWPLSRSRWWGHQISAWYTPNGDVIVAESEEAAVAEARAKFGDDVSLERDPEVFDTWFSSGIWPLATLGWPHTECDTFKTFYPTDVLVTGWDILFFWVSRMVNLALQIEGEVPFKHVYLHPLLAGDDGKKMSKSRGNIINPLTMMDKYGTDAMRFAICASMIEAAWMQLPESRIQGYRNFANKIWNASRFVMMNLKEFEPDPNAELKLGTADKWIRSRFNTVAKEVNDSLDRFRFADAANALYDFLWHEYCDWYIELAKIRLYGLQDEAEVYTTKHVLWEALDGTLRLLHPFMPFITEEIWQHLPHEGDSICRAHFPMEDESRHDTDAERQMTVVMDTIRAIRNVRGEMNIAPNAEINVLAHSASEWERETLASHTGYLESLAKIGDLKIAASHEKPKASATAVAGGVEAFIPLEGVIDIGEEIARLDKELVKVENDLARVTKNLGNENFINRAPETIVQQERERQTNLGITRETLERNLRLLKEM
ncbi:MAG: valine--tRNA ligase [Candidatus Poribacteria bacterium]|nr:valine--tRNA ligase [Candidatus Poribacteria bacterium]